MWSGLWNLSFFQTTRPVSPRSTSTLEIFVKDRFLVETINRLSISVNHNVFVSKLFTLCSTFSFVIKYVSKSSILEKNPMVGGVAGIVTLSRLLALNFPKFPTK